MQVRILGCSGGIGAGRHTTSFLVDDDVLIDAGSGLTTLSLAELARIDHLFLTHAHLDHLLALPAMMDSVGGERGRPLTLHALPEVLEVLKRHLFNWELWPDFTRIPSAAAPFLVYAPLAIGEETEVGGRRFTAIPARHTVPAAGYLIRGGAGSLLFSGDTASHPALWEVARATADLCHLIVEVSFPNALRPIADAALHYCPQTLLPDLSGYTGKAQVWLTHLKPGGELAIVSEVLAGAPAGLEPRALEPGQVLAHL